MISKKKELLFMDKEVQQFFSKIHTFDLLNWHIHYYYCYKKIVHTGY